MKRIIASIMILCLVFSVAYAEQDLSAMSEKELYDLLNSVRNELATKTAHIEENQFIIDSDNIQIYCTGNAHMNYSNDFCIEVVFVNNTDKELGISIDHITINGWEVNSYVVFTPIKAGRKAKEEIELKYQDANLSSYKQIEDIALSISTYDANTYESLKEFDEVILHFDGNKWN